VIYSFYQAAKGGNDLQGLPAQAVSGLQQNGNQYRQPKTAIQAKTLPAPTRIAPILPNFGTALAPLSMFFPPNNSFSLQLPVPRASAPARC
jgi:hypothetical protein